MIWLALIIALILLFVFPKQVGILVLVVACGAGLFYIYLLVDENNRARLQDSILVSAAYNTQSCSEEYPLAVNFSNQSKKTIASIRWRFEAFNPGYSTNIVGFQIRKHESDKIIKPSSSVGFCYRVPELNRSISPSSLEWKIADKEVSFIKD